MSKETIKLTELRFKYVATKPTPKSYEKLLAKLEESVRKQIEKQASDIFTYGGACAKQTICPPKIEHIPFLSVININDAT